MHVAFLKARAGDLDEFGFLVQLGDRLGTNIAHGRAQATHHLVDDRAERALERHLAFNTFRHELFLCGILLEVTVGRAARHCAEAAHAAIGLVRTALIQEHLARRFFRAREHGAHHRGGGPGGQRLGKIAREFDAAIGNHRNTA